MKDLKITDAWLGMNWHKKDEWWEDDSGKYMVLANSVEGEDSPYSWTALYIPRPHGDCRLIGDYPTLLKAQAAAEKHALKKR